jgi:ABC1 atypical kinase-like domain
VKRQARLLARVMARLTRLNVTGLADELALRIVEELDYVREGRVQSEVAAAFADRVPEEIALARAAGVREPEGRTRVKVPVVYAATPRVLITGWLDGVSLSTLLDGRTDLLPEGWRELSPGNAADLAGRLLSHAIYAPAACAGWMHADLHPGNFLLLPGGRLGMLDFGAAAAIPGGIPAPFGQLAGAVLAGNGPMAVRLARRIGALAPGCEQPDPRLVVELLHPIVAAAAADTFTYSRPWLRGLMAHFAEPRFAATLRNLMPPREYALVWRATLSAAALFAQLDATVPTRGFHLAYSPGFRGSVLHGRGLPSQGSDQRHLPDHGTGRHLLRPIP